MAYNTDKLSLLRHLARAGDKIAEAVLYAMAGEETSASSTGTETLYSVDDIAAKSATSVHATVYGDASGPVSVTTAITNPLYSRNLRCTFGANWDGGNVTIVGTNQFGVAVSELFTAVAGNVVVGVKIFKTVTSIAYLGGGSGTHGSNTLTVGTGDKLAIGTLHVVNTFALLTLGTGVPEAVTIDTTYHAFTPTTVPDGSVDYRLLVRV